MTSQHSTGTHPFYIGMYIHICTYIYFSEGMFMYFFGTLRQMAMDGLLDPVVGLGAKWRATWATLGHWGDGGWMLCFWLGFKIIRSKLTRRFCFGGY